MADGTTFNRPTRPSADPRLQHADPVDVHVGARIRTRRKALKISQQDLAAKLDLTFQQVQKYERGSNRVSASKLYLIAAHLGVPVAFFFEGMPQDGGTDAPEADFLASPEGIAMARAFAPLTRRQRLAVIEVASAMNTAAGGEA